MGLHFGVLEDESEFARICSGRIPGTVSSSARSSPRSWTRAELPSSPGCQRIKGRVVPLDSSSECFSEEESTSRKRRTKSSGSEASERVSNEALSGEERLEGNLVGPVRPRRATSEAFSLTSMEKSWKTSVSCGFVTRATPSMETSNQSCESANIEAQASTSVLPVGLKSDPSAAVG